MSDLTTPERRTLAGLGAAALVGLLVLGWQRWTPPLAVRDAAPPAPGAEWDAALQTARQIDVNTASVAELERLPGVGPALARRIAQYRTAHGAFRTAEELMRVPGIGPQTFTGLHAYVTVESATNGTRDRRDH